MDTKELLQEILASPSSAAFSRIRYVRTLMDEEEQTRSLKELYAKAVEAREAGAVGGLADLLEEWEEKGIALAGVRAGAGGRSDAVDTAGYPGEPGEVRAGHHGRVLR